MISRIVGFVVGVLMVMIGLQSVDPMKGALLIVGYVFGELAIAAIWHHKEARKWLCRHRHLEVFRAHRESAYSMAWPDEVAWVDRHDVNTYIRCAACHTPLKVTVTERLYDSKEK